MGFSVNYNAGGVVDLVKRIGTINGFPEFTQPYNEMVAQDIPALDGDYEITYTTPDEEVEVMAITVTCTGYGSQDKYDLFCNDIQWFKDWYTSEVKEGLFLGTSTYVYKTPANTVFKLIFKNRSKTSKTLYIGFRMLRKYQEGGS